MSNTPLGPRLALMSFMMNFAVEASNIFLPLYARSLGASNLEVGFVAASYGITYFLSSLVFGRQSDIHGRLVYVRGGLLLSVLAYLSQVVTPSPMALLVARGFVGFCLGLVSAAVMAYTYENQKQVGRFASYGALGWLFAALAAAVLKDYGPLFIASAATSLIAFLVALTFREEPANRVRLLVSLLPLLRSNLRVYFTILLRQLGSQAAWAIFPLYLVGIGADLSWIAAISAINVAVQFVGMRLVERFNPALMFRAGLLFSALAFAAYGMATSYLQVVPVQVLLGVGWSCLFIGGLSYLMRKNTERGSVSGLFYSTNYLSAGLGPFIGGAVSEVWSFAAVMHVASALSLVAFLSSRGMKTGDERPPLPGKEGSGRGR